MPGLVIEFIQKPADFDKFMSEFPAFIRVGDQRWVYEDRLGITTVTASETSDGHFLVVTNSPTALHIPWERANKIGKEILSRYKETCRLKPLK